MRQKAVRYWFGFYISSINVVLYPSNTENPIAVNTYRWADPVEYCLDIVMDHNFKAHGEGGGVYALKQT